MKTADSYIGWLDYSEAERRRMLDVVELLGERDTVDELGIGTVRDALADRLFPGTSTLQTRARYLLFVPWIFQELEAERLNPRSASRRLRTMEAELIDALRAGGETMRGAGVIGIQRGIQTMRLPSSIYWSGLRVMKIRTFEGSIQQYLGSLTSFTRRVAHMLKGDGDELVERSARRWDEVPSPPTGWLESTTMALRSDEADYLSHRIATAVPGTVFAHLAARRIRPAQHEAFLWDSSARASLPPALQDQVEHARLFSLVMHGALLLYNFELAVLVDDDELEEAYAAELQDWMDRIQIERPSLMSWQRDAFWALVYDTRGWVKGPVKGFIDGWIDLALSGQDVRPLGEARRLIAEREKRLKGNLSRIGNQRARDRWNRASGTGQLGLSLGDSQPASPRHRPCETVVTGETVLDPRERYLLLDAFRPPDGYTFDMGVGTSFALDLEALLLAPLALAAFDAEAQDGAITSDPIALLEATRRLADRLTLFTSAGRISVPRRYQPALAWLEDSIVEVTPPTRRGVFHPKLWLLRFAKAEGGAARYRLISTSRNLTFDRSWDTLVCLEGEPSEDRSAQQTDHLMELVRELPGLAVQDLAAERTNSLLALARELETVQFQDPPGTKETRFFVLGVGRANRWPFDKDVSNLLVVSPFVTADLLTRLPPAGQRRLVSRSETLDALGMDALKGWDTYVMSAAAGDVGDASPDPEAEPRNGDETSTPEETSSELAGLHAKIYALSMGKRARLLTGSANATNAGFGDNVEVLIAFEGSIAQVGPDTVWGDASGGLAAITESYTPPDVPILPPDEWEVKRELDAVLAGIASLGWQIAVHPTAEELYDLEIATAEAVPPNIDGTLRCWLLSIGPGRSCPIEPGRIAAGVVAGVSLETISPYLVVELTLGKVRARSVVNATLSGDPPDRRQRVLSSALGSQTAVVRYLLFLLSGLGDDALVEIARRLGGAAPPGNGEQTIPVPLFEALVRALSREPTRIDIVQRLVEDLSAAEDGRKLLPDGFDEIWKPILEARAAQTQ